MTDLGSFVAPCRSEHVMCQLSETRFGWGRFCTLLSRAGRRSLPCSLQFSLSPPIKNGVDTALRAADHNTFCCCVDNSRLRRGSLQSVPCRQCCATNSELDLECRALTLYEILLTLWTLKRIGSETLSRHRCEVECNASPPLL